MELLIVSHSGRFYGAEKSLLAVAKGLSISGHNVTVLVPNEGELKEELEKQKIHVIVWRYYGWLGRDNRILKGAFRLVFNLTSCILFLAIKHPKTSLVYTNTITTPFGVFYAVLTRKSHVWHIREFVHEDMGADFDLPKKWIRFFYFMNLRFSICNSISVNEKFKRYFGNHKSIVVYNAVDVPGVAQNNTVRMFNDSDEVKLLMVSSLHEGKGHIEAISALAKILRYYPNAVLTIAGNGDQKYLKRLKMLVSEKKLEENVTFKGYVKNPSELMAGSDVFLMCSKNEAFGRVTLEAMSAGCPVIGANSGGTREILDDGKYGMLYEQGNASDLANKITELLSNDHERKRYSELGKSRSQHFSNGFMIESIESALECSF